MSMRAVLRRAARAARRTLRAERPVVLMYHRVEALSLGPWNVAVEPSRFSRQIERLCKTRRIVPLSWLADKIIAGDLPRRVAAVTFDDGYGDVFKNALPVLEAQGCQATVFLTTGAVDSERGFWWDVLTRIVLETPHLPEHIGIDVDGERHEFTLAGEPGGAGLDRQALLSSLHGLLRPLEAGERDDALHRLASLAGTDAEARPHDLAMTSDQVRSLAAAEVIEIGAHSVTHPPFTSRSPSDLAREVGQSRRRCEALIGRPVTGFAYPYGDFDAASRAAVRSAGLTHACTTVERSLRRGGDPFAIPRIGVANWTEDEFRREVLTFA